MNAFVSGYNNSNVLPHTGKELVLYVVVGLAITASGFALRALTKDAK